MLLLQAKKVMDVEVYCQQIVVKKRVLIMVPDFQQNWLQMV